MRVYCPNCGSENEGQPAGTVTCRACTMTFDMPRVESAPPPRTGPVDAPKLPPPPPPAVLPPPPTRGPTFSGTVGGPPVHIRQGPSGPPPQLFGVGTAASRSTEPPVNSLAVASLVLGLLCCIPFSGVGALTLGFIARNQIDASHGQQRGRELAMAGMIIGILSISLTALSLLGRVFKRL